MSNHPDMDITCEEPDPKNRIRFRLSLKRGCRSRDVVFKGIIRKLSCRMHKELDRLTSESHRPHWIAPKLRLMTYGPIVTRNGGKITERIHKIRLPLITDPAREKGLVNFWHEITKCKFKQRVEKVCIQLLLVPGEIKRVNRVKKLVLEAYDMSMAGRFNGWELNSMDGKYWDDAMEIIAELDGPFDDYLPMSVKQLAILDGRGWDDSNVFRRQPPAICLTAESEKDQKKDMKKTKKTKKRKPNPPIQRRPALSRIDFGPINSTGNMRQTKIEEYFNFVKTERGA